MMRRSYGFSILIIMIRSLRSDRQERKSENTEGKIHAIEKRDTSDFLALLAEPSLAQTFFRRIEFLSTGSFFTG